MVDNILLALRITLLSDAIALVVQMTFPLAANSTKASLFSAQTIAGQASTLLHPDEAIVGELLELNHYKLTQ